MLARLDADPNYLTDVLPALVLFGLGLSMTVAPLTTTVLDSVEERHVGVASGVNNAVSRVAGVLAIAALGAVISAQFSSTLDQTAPPVQLSADGGVGDRGREGAAALRRRRQRRPGAGGARRSTPRSTTPSESAFHLGMLLGAVLMALGGVISLLGVRNPEGEPEREPVRGPGSAATAGECGRCAEGDTGPEPEPEPVAARA